MRIRFNNSRKIWYLSLPQGGMLILCQSVRCIKRQDLTTPNGSPRNVRNSLMLLAIDSPMWNWTLPFYTPFLLLLILLVVPCLINFLSRFPQKQIQISLTRLLISCYYRITSPKLKSQRPETQLYPNCEDELHTNDFDALILHEVVY